MANQEVFKRRCQACYGSLAYLAGYCPVCNDSGYVEIKTEDLMAKLKSKSFEFFADEDEFSYHDFLF